MASSENLFVSLTDGRYTGLGELSPATGSAWTAERGQVQLEAFAGWGLGDNPFDNYARMRDAEVDPPAMAALDMAMWDLLAKQAQMPLNRLLGLPRRSKPTSVTIGINPPEVTRERVTKILEQTGAKCLKIKLGSPEGRDHDKEHFLAAATSAEPFGVALRVDANGGWSVDEARMMNSWLAERHVEYVEQPLPEGQEADLPKLFENRPLPIFVDETIRYAPDVLKVRDCVDGINLKLMKCGGITEALRIVATARACGLKTMIGCMSESSVAIAAGASIAALFDYVDLDSHTNLNPDPAFGAAIEQGIVLPMDRPGHGAELIA
jgi:L-alanine-DL-glutamate epimerase-like enolase superfamily enzyme